MAHTGGNAVDGQRQRTVQPPPVAGASGTAEVFVLLPITLISTTWMAYTYIGLFSLGCAITMGSYGYVVGRFYRRANATGQRIYRALVIATSASGLVLGAIWILRNLS